MRCKKILKDFEIQMNCPIPARISVLIHKIKFAISADYRVKIKESEKLDKRAKKTC